MTSYVYVREGEVGKGWKDGEIKEGWRKTEGETGCGW